MDLNDENDLNTTPDPNANIGTPLDMTQINPDAPDFVQDIRKKGSNIPVDINVQFIPQNPYTMTSTASSLGESTDIEGIQDIPSFYQTAKSAAKAWNYTYQGANAIYGKTQEENPLLDVPPTDWTPKTDVAKFVNVQPQYLKYLFEATGPKDQDYRLQKIYQEQQDDQNYANGSFTAKLVGGAVGIVSDPMSYIPIVGWAKYGKLAPTFLKSAARALPGAATYAVLSSGAEQANKINGNMQDFLTDSFVRTVFGSVLFGVGGVAAQSLDNMALWDLKAYAKQYVDGVDYKFAVDKTGKVTGFKAVDRTGSLSAAKVSFAQDLADSSFSKSGLFKIPYLGTAVTKFLSNPVLGTPLPQLLNSPFKTVRGFVDRVMDHSIITEGVAAGKAAPQKFSSLMNQEFAGMRSLSAQVDALLLERNGFDINNRPLGGLVNLGLNLKDKGLKLLGKDLNQNNYISREAFHSEMEEVLRTEVPSKHGPVNEGAGLMRKQMDKTYTAYRKAYNLPEDWLPPKTAEGYLMRVYDTPYLNANEPQWIEVVSGWLREADEQIARHMEPITTLSQRIEAHEANHIDLINRPNITDAQVKLSSDELFAMKARRKALQENLQNEMRTNPDLHIHVDDWNALSADEVKQIKAHTKNRDLAKKEFDDLKKVIAGMKQQVSKSESAAIKSKTVDTAKGNAGKRATAELAIGQEQLKLDILERKLDEEEQKLQQLMQSGQIDSRLYRKIPDSSRYEFKDISNRLSFRKTYETHAHREKAAKAYYDTIMNQTAEDTINQVMGKFTGNRAENHIKQRTLLIPDEVLYQNNFMTKDLMSKVSNYTTYLSRRTHLKTVFNDVSIDGGIEPILNELNAEYERFRVPLNNKKMALKEKLADKELSATERKALEKQAAKVDEEFANKRKELDKALEDLNRIYEKMMGIHKLSRRAQRIKSGIMSFTAMANLPFVPFTMINDLSAIGLQHGIIPFIRDGIYPMVESLAGIMKTKDSEAFRKTAPSINLALQDIGMGYADRNWSMQNSPYLNLGKIAGTLEWMAHASSNFTLTNYIDNGLQRFTSSVVQSEIMRIMNAFKLGKMSKRDGLYVRKYGIDPKEWADRMLAAFKQDGGGKTKLGGYQSNFWHWQDLEAANKLSSAVFRGVKDTQIQAGLVDSPMWTEDNGPLGVVGSIIKGFNGWMYASVNRYVIPSMQNPDAEKLLGVMFMLGTGALVSPMRRMARGESPYPETMTPEQWAFQTVQDSGYFSFFMNTLADANVLTGDRLLGNLKNDKYKDRTRAGLLGPAWGTANRMADVIGALASGEMNQADALKMARMTPFANGSWTFNMSKKLIESLQLPKTRSQARALKQLNQ